MLDWAKENIGVYSAILVVVTVLVCWIIMSSEHLKAQMVAPDFESAHTAALLDSIRRKRDGLTYVDLALEDQILAPR